MEEAVLLCRAGAQDRPSSLSASLSGDAVTLSVNGDGFSCYDADTLEKRCSYALGSAAAVFAAPVQHGTHGALVAAVHPAGGGAPSLVLLHSSADTGGATTAAAKSILDSQPQIKLPGPVAAVHALGAGGGPAGSIAVVLADGSVAGADFEHHKLRPLAASSSSNAAGVADTAAAAGRPATRARGGAAAAAAVGSSTAIGAGRPAASAAAGGYLAVAWQPGGSGGAAALSFYRAIKTHPFLEQIARCELPAPEASARLLTLHLAPGGVAGAWSGGCVSAHAFDYRTGGQRAPSGGAFSTEPLLKQLGLDGGNAAVAAGGRKRKAAAAGDAAGAAASAPRPLVAALGDAQLLLAAVAAGANGNAAELRYVVVDARYGCVLSTGAARLPGVDAATAADAATQLVVLRNGSGSRAAVAVAGAVFLVSVDTPRADLAGLLGRLVVATEAGSRLPRIGAAGSSAAAKAAAKAAAEALPTAPLTCTTVQLDVGALVAGALQAEAAQQGPEGAVADGEGGMGLLLPATEPAAAAGEDGVAVAAQRLAAVLDEGEAARGAAAAPPPAWAKQLESATLALVQQLKGQASAQGHPARAAIHRRRRSSAAAQQLLGRAASTLAEAGLWAPLQQLLAAQPLQSLVHAPRLLPLAAEAHQHDLVSDICYAARDLPAQALLDALLSLLSDDLPGASGAAAAKARTDRRAALRSAAAAIVDAAAEATTDDQQRQGSIAAARAAAAAVDGFSAREVCLHALVAGDVDAVEAQAALQQLPARHVLRLLRYLSKWASKYGDQPLEVAVAEAGDALPQGLRGPPLPQVLDWLRALLDAHLTKLALMPAAAEPLRRLAGDIGAQSAAVARLAPLRGVAEYMRAGGALPVAAAAAASTYTVELLDLRVRSQ